MTQALRTALEGFGLDLHTGFPARVRSFDHATQTCEVEPLIRRVLPATDDDEADATEALPILQSVPILYPRGGGFAMSWPLTAGDVVYVVVAESDLSQWFFSGEVSDPGIGTRHGLSGAIAIPGLFHRSTVNASASATDLRIERAGGPAVVLTASEVRAGGSVALAEGPDVRAHLQAISTALASLTSPSGAVTSPTPYVYATVLGSAPIDTTITKGT